MTKLTITELAAESVELLPGRETLALFDFDVNFTNIAAWNGAMAVNGGGAGSSANAWALQSIHVVNYNS